MALRTLETVAAAFEPEYRWHRRAVALLLVLVPATGLLAIGHYEDEPCETAGRTWLCTDED